MADIVAWVGGIEAKTIVGWGVAWIASSLMVAFLAARWLGGLSVPADEDYESEEIER